MVTHLTSEECNTGVIYFQEKWLKEEHTLAELHLEGYKEYSEMGTHTQVGGGNIYFRSYLIVIRLQQYSNDMAEMAMAQIHKLNCIVANI